MSSLDQTCRAFTDSGGRALPLLHTRFGSTKSLSMTTSPIAATSIHSNSFDTPVRLWAEGVAVLYIFGGSGVAAPDATGGYIGQDRYVETYMTSDETHIRAQSVTGSGSLKVEILA